MFIHADVDVKNPDEPISRKEFNDLKIVVSDLKILVEALLKKSNQQLSSSIKRKEIYSVVHFWTIIWSQYHISIGSEKLHEKRNN